MLEERLAGTNLRASQFMERTDIKLDMLLKQSNEWAGVRKTLAAIAVFLTLCGALVGYVAHYFWAPGAPPH